jgi:hypothetical protein
VNQTIDIALADSLKAIYKTNDEARSLLDNFAARKRDVSETTVERAAQLTGSSYNEMLGAFRELAATGAGAFKVGRHGAKTRIEWEYSVRSLGAAAKGEGRPVKLDPEELEDSEDEEIASEADALEEGDVVHEFLLRPGRKIRLELPADLTQREAERLAGFVQSLPFDDGYSS